MADDRAHNTLTQLLEHAESLKDQGELEVALQFYRRAVEVAPNSADVMWSLGETCAELGEAQDATTAFKKCIELDNECDSVGAHALMYLGQMNQGLDAVEMFERGIAALQRQLSRRQAEAQSKAQSSGGLSEADMSSLSAQQLLLRNQIASGLCTLTELYMTDLCFEPDAEARCERYTAEAVNVQPDNAEAFTTLANLRIVQKKNEEAKSAIQRACELIQAAETKIEQHSNAMDSTSDSPADPLFAIQTQLPPFDSRFSLAKAALELELYDEACNVLEGLLLEDDDNMEIWFLASEAYGGAKDFTTAIDYVDRALGALKKHRESGRLDSDPEAKAENKAATEQFRKLRSALLLQQNNS